jgi:TetR/AcrR family transcriptional regulator, mexJK operon transcriptional repressor
MVSQGQADASSPGGEGKRRGPGRPSLSNEQLLDRALDLFLENGFDGTSIDSIAATAGMAKRTIYTRYGDKTRLFQAALGRAIEDWLVPIDLLRAQETDDFEETLQRIGAILVDNVLNPEGLRLLRLTNAESVRMPEIAADNVRRSTTPTLEYLADLFRRRLARKPGDFAEAESAAGAFLNIVVGGPASSAAWGMRIDPGEVERHTRYSVHLFLHGLLDTEATQMHRENQRLREVLAEASRQLEEVRSALDAQR